MMAPWASRARTKRSKARPASLVKNRSTTGRQSAATGQRSGAHSVKRGTSPANMSGRGKHSRQSRTRVGGAHESLAHQEGVDTGRPHAQHVVAGVDATLTHQQTVGRQFAHERQGGVQRNLKSFEISVVDADQRRFELQRARQLGRIVHFHQHRHVQAARNRFKVLHSRIIQNGRNQQYGIGPTSARFINLIGVQHEVFAQHRQRAGGAGLLEVVNATLEKLQVGEYRQTGCTMLRIALRYIGGDEILAQHALGWAGFFDLGNHSGLPGGDLAAQGGDKIPCQHTRLGISAHRGQGFAGNGCRDFLAFDGHDFFQNVGHFAAPFSCWDMETSCASLALSAPDSMAARALAMPALIVGTTLAAYSATPAWRITMSLAAPGTLSNTPSSMVLDCSGVSTLSARLLAMTIPKSSG